MPPATPARPNHFGIFRARQAASDELTITAAAAADDGAANRRVVEQERGSLERR